MFFRFPRWRAAISGSPIMPADRCWSSTPPRCAASRRNMPDCRKLWTEFHGRGLMIIGVPSNDFGGQEPGGATEIAHTAQQHGVTFPITAKAVVKGPNAHPFYKWAADTAEGCSRLELSQVSGRPRRLYRRRVPRRSSRPIRASKPPSRGRSRHPDAPINRSTDKSGTFDKSRCRGGAGPTRLCDRGGKWLGRSQSRSHGII